MRPGPSLVHVIDDDEAVRDSIAVLLEVAGFPARTYASALLFLEEARRAVPAGCIVTDLQMPGMSGLALLRSLRELGLRLPAIVISARAERAEIAEVMAAGAVRFLSKPLDEREFLDVVGAAMQQSNEGGK